MKPEYLNGKDPKIKGATSHQEAIWGLDMAKRFIDKCPESKDCVLVNENWGLTAYAYQTKTLVVVELRRNNEREQNEESPQQQATHQGKTRMEKVRFNQVTEGMGTREQGRSPGSTVGIKQETETVKYIYAFNVAYQENSAQFFVNEKTALKEFKKAVDSALKVLGRHGRMSVSWNTEVTPEAPTEYETCYMLINCCFSRLRTIQKVTVFNEFGGEVDVFQLVRMRTND